MRRASKRGISEKKEKNKRERCENRKKKKKGRGGAGVKGTKEGERDVWRDSRESESSSDFQRDAVPD